MGARLRAEDPRALQELRKALTASPTIARAAARLGFSGPGSLWRIAYAVPAVRDALRERNS